MTFLRYLKHFPKVILSVYSMFRASDVANLPFGIKFEVSCLCNLKCVMCPLNKGLKRKRGILSFENFKKVYDEVKPPYLNLTGIGEPLLNPNLFDIIRYAKKEGSIVKLDTNATLLNNRRIVSLLLSSPDIVSVSIDGSNKETYEKIRTGAKYEEVIKNLKNLINRRNKMDSRTKVHVNFVMQKGNVEEIAEFILFIDSLGVDSINGDIALSLGSNTNEQNREIKKEVLVETKQMLDSLQISSSLNIEHITEFLDEKLAGKKKSNKHCFYPWYYPSVTWEGDMVPCCYVCDNEVVFGNVIKNSFKEVWNEEKIKSFRKMLAKGRKGICEDCFIDESFIAEKIKLISKIPLLSMFSARKF